MTERMTKTPKFTTEDKVVIHEACVLAGLLAPGQNLPKDDVTHFGIMLYQMRAESEAKRLAALILQIEVAMKTSGFK